MRLDVGIPTGLRKVRAAMHPRQNARLDIRKLASVDNAGANALLRITTLVESRHRQLSIVGTLPEIANATSAHQ
jgi:anti-anti-sigma regulatory factor